MYNLLSNGIKYMKSESKEELITAKKSIKKNAALNFIKQFLKIAFPLITFPYVSRVLLEENLGKYNFSQSIISYFILIAELGVSAYGVREGARIRNDSKKLNKFCNQIFTINMIFTFISYLLLCLLYLWWDKLHSYTLLLAILSGVILFNTLGMDWVNSVFEDYAYMTKRYIFIKTISLIMIFSFVKTKTDYIIYGSIIAGSDILANIINIFYVRKYVQLHFCRPNIRKHLLPLLIIFANSVAITVYTNIDITMLGIFQNDSVVGIYSVSSKINQIVKNLITGVITVIIPRLAAYIGSNEIDKYNLLLNKTIKAIIIVILPSIVGLIMLSNEIIMLLGGVNYMEGNSAFRMLSFALLPGVLSMVFLNGILIVNRREKYCLIATAVGSLVNVILNIILIPAISINGAAITTVIAEFTCCLLAINFANGYHKISFKIDRDFYSVIVGTIIVWIVCLLNNRLFCGYSLILTDIIASLVLYFIVLILAKNSIITEVINSVMNRLKKGK